MGLVWHSDVAAPRAVLRTRIAASFFGSGYNGYREQTVPQARKALRYSPGVAPIAWRNRLVK
jgi:hypothetical protein